MPAPAGAAELAAADPEPHQADQHADARGDEHVLVGRHGLGTEQLVGQDAGQHRGEQRAGVDAHVEDGEARVAARVVDAIQLPDHAGDVGLEQAVAGDDRGQADAEHPVIGNGDQEQAQRHHRRADQDRALVADDAVGDEAAEQRRRVDQRQVGAIELAGPGLAFGELGDDVQRQCPADAVEREAFPELGHEQHPQRTRVAEEVLELRHGRRGGCGIRRGSAHAGFPPE